MGTLFKKLVAAITILSFTATGSAGLFQDALSSFGTASTTTNTPGVYRGIDGNYVSFGGFSMTSPIQSNNINLQLYSVTPFKVTHTGCGGIDVILGGFEFISGDKIKQLFQSITSLAPAFVLHAVLKWLCPQCEAIVQAMENLVNQANSYDLNACSVLSSMNASVDKWVDGNNAGLIQLPTEKGKIKSDLEGVCRSLSAEGNTGFLSKLSDSCKTTADKFATDLESRISDAKASPDPSGNAQIDIYNDLCFKKGLCNTTWEILKASQCSQYEKGFCSDAKSNIDSQDNIDSRILLMNLLGTSVPKSPQEAIYILDSVKNQTFNADDMKKKLEGDPDLFKSLYQAPTMNASDVYDMMMCGTNPANAKINSIVSSTTSNPNDQKSLTGEDAYLNHKAVQLYCSAFFSKFATRDNPKGAGVIENDPSQIAQAMQSFVSSKQVITCTDTTSYCMNIQIVPMAQSSAFNIDKGLLLQIGGILDGAVLAVQQGKPLDPTAISLIASAPFPLYQVINMAAIYPSAATDLLDSVTGYLADIIIKSKIEAVMQVYNRNGQVYADGASVRAVAISKALDQLKETITNRSREFMLSMNSQEAFLKSLSDLQLATQREIVSQDLLGASQFAKSSLTLSYSKPTVNPGAQP